MKVLTEINSDCSFMQTIIKLPQKRVDLISAGIDKNIVDKLENYLAFAKDIQTLFQSISHLKIFIEYAIENCQVYYVKTFSEDLEDLSENREFICFGDYHRNAKDQHNLLFRIDQNWDNFNFPSIDNFYNLKTFFSFLSGATVHTNLPSIILEQPYLNDISEIILNNKLEPIELENLYLFSTDYFEKSYFFNSIGEVFYLTHKGKTIEKSGLDFKQWLDNELNRILKTKEVEE